jgi:ATP-binding cassette subfamily B protein
MAMEGKRTLRIGPTVGTVAPLGASGSRMLSQVTLFAALSARDLRRVAGLAEETWFNPGRVVVQEGKPGSSFYVILDGTARVKRGRSGRTLRKLEPGDYFGELALLTGGPRTASVIAETSLDTIRIQRPALRKLLLKEPEVALRIMAGLAERIAECERQLPG